MKKSLFYIVFADMMFILFLALSGFFNGLLGDLVFLFGYILPIALIFFACQSGRVEYSSLGFNLTRDTVKTTVHFAMPTLLLVFGVSYLTSLILSAVTIPPETDVSGNIISVIITHALFPSVFEEILFRLIPISLLLPFGKRNAVVLSSVVFALIHGSFYQIPYALLAGVAFAAIDIMCESIYPSVILHFLNNLISIIWMRGASSVLFTAVFMIVFVLLAITSLVFIINNRRDYFTKFKDALSSAGKTEFSAEFIVMIVSLAVIAVANTFA